MASAKRGSERRRLASVAGQYDASAFDTAMRGYMMRTLEPWRRPGKALQVGCFHGDFTEPLAEVHEDLTVVDGTRAFLERTRRRVRRSAGRDIACHLGLFEQYRTRERYDAIYLVHILEHVTRPVPFLARARRLLAPGGRVYVIVPNGGAASRRIAVKMRVLPRLEALSAADRKHGHRRIYFLDTLQDDLGRAGLSVAAAGGIFYKPLANFQFDGLMGGKYLSDAYLEGCFRLGPELPEQCASLYAIGEAAA